MSVLFETVLQVVVAFFLVENLVWFFYWYSAQDLRPVFKKHNWISINQTEFQNLRQARCDSVEFFRLFSNCLLPLYFFGCMSLGEKKKKNEILVTILLTLGLLGDWRRIIWNHMHFFFVKQTKSRRQSFLDYSGITFLEIGRSITQSVVMALKRPRDWLFFLHEQAVGSVGSLRNEA